MASSNDFPELTLLGDIVHRRGREIYCVGGFLRDLLLTRQSRDMDFAVRKDAVKLARAFARRVRGTFVLLDDERGCARVVKKKNGEIWTFDFADFRAPTFKKDLALRDFTVNTLALDLAGADPQRPLLRQMMPNAKARADLKAGAIRVLSRRAFVDDPLRLLRAYSLAAQLGFRIEPKTRKAIRANARLIRTVSPERVREELFKVLASPRAAATFKAMERDGLLFAVIPQLRVMHRVHQGRYHHLDVWEHSLEAVRQLEKLFTEFAGNADLASYLDKEIAGGHSRRTLLKFACLLHDIGKPDTRKKEPEGRTSFHGHEHAGRGITRIVARRFLLSSKERHALEDLVTHHLRPGYLSNFRKPSDRAVFRFFRDAKDETVSTLLLSVADQRATRGPMTQEKDVRHHEKIAFSLIVKYFQKQKTKPFVRLITGDDLIRTLRLKPGPVFAKILRAVEEAQHLGEVRTQEDALVLTRKVAGSCGKPGPGIGRKRK